MLVDHAGDVVFVPGDPPRRGRFALLRPEPIRGAPGRVSDIEVVAAAGTGVRRRLVVARLVPIGLALGWLAALPADAAAATSARAWSLAVKAGLGLVARGRLLPGISRGGFDAWRVGPLDPADEAWLRALAAAFPLEGHALPLPSVRPIRVRSPEALVRDCWDAIADTMARSPAASRVVRSRAFSGTRPVRVEGLRDWLETATQGGWARERAPASGSCLHRRSTLMKEDETPSPPSPSRAADPFTILQLRGRDRDQVLAGLRRLRASGGTTMENGGGPRRAAAGPRDQEDAGVEVRTLFARRLEAPLPTSPPLPSHAGEPAILPTDPPPGTVVDAEDLAVLARDAAGRALDLCRGVGDGGLGLAPEADLARLAAQKLGRPGFDRLAERVGVAPRSLMRLALAWAAGGAAALEVLDGPSWRPPAEDIEEGAAALRRAMGATVRGERVTCGRRGVQLRLGRDGLRYLLLRRAGVWEIHDSPAADPATLLSRGHEGEGISGRRRGRTGHRRRTLTGTLTTGSHAVTGWHVGRTAEYEATRQDTR